MSGRNWQGIPDWLIYAVRRQHAEAMSTGRARAAEEAVEYLTDRLLADDPEFARVIVARYVRTLVRAPKPRKREKDPRRDALMADCARMDAEGMSLRAIGQAKGLAHSTVRGLIAEWATRTPEMAPALVRAATPVDGRSVNPQVDGFTPQPSADPNVIPLRRLA